MDTLPLLTVNDEISVAESDSPPCLPDLLPRQDRGKTSFLKILIHLFKSNLGVGMLNMPQNMSRAGIIFGPIVALIFIIPVVYATFTLLKCAKEIKKRTGKVVIGYAGTFRYSVIDYLHERSRFVVYLVNFFLITSQLGICIVYIKFAAETLQDVTEEYFQNENILVIIIGAAIFLPSMISNLEVMSILSGSATVFCLFSLACTFYYIIDELKSLKKYNKIGTLQEFPLFLSSLLYAYEGINAVIPLENEIDDPSMYPLALKISTAGTTFLYFTMGLLGYIAYGNATKSSITFNLPVGLFSNTIKLIFALGVLLTFFIQFHVAMSAIIPTILKKISNNKMAKILSYTLRCIFVLAIIVCAIAIPQLDQAISLIGAFACAGLALIFPSIIHLATFWNYTDENKITRFKMTVDISIIIFGVLLCISGVFSSILSITQAYEKINT